MNLILISFELHRYVATYRMWENIGGGMMHNLPIFLTNTYKYRETTEALPSDLPKFSTLVALLPAIHQNFTPP